MRTSYFAKLKKIKHPIAICGWPPRFYTGPTYKSLAPKKEWFFEWKKMADSGDYSREELEAWYIERYNATVLSKLDPQKVWDDLCAIYPGVRPDDIYLLCYEKRGDFCHRHLAAKWLRDNGFDVSEDEAI